MLDVVMLFKHEKFYENNLKFMDFDGDDNNDDTNMDKHEDKMKNNFEKVSSFKRNHQPCRQHRGGAL